MNYCAFVNLVFLLEGFLLLIRAPSKNHNQRLCDSNATRITFQPRPLPFRKTGVSICTGWIIENENRQSTWYFKGCYVQFENFGVIDIHTDSWIVGNSLIFWFIQCLLTASMTLQYVTVTLAGKLHRFSLIFIVNLFVSFVEVWRLVCLFHLWDKIVWWTELSFEPFWYVHNSWQWRL